MFTAINNRLAFKLLSFAVIFTFAFYNRSLAQNNNRVIGSVIDFSASPLINANISLISGPDTLKTQTDSDGKFRFEIKKVKDFRLQVSHVGFAEFNGGYKINASSDSIVIAPVTLIAHVAQLKEVTIKNTRQSVRFKKDTVTYEVDAFKDNLSDKDLIESLLKKLPGLEMDNNGSLTSEGKPVTKLRVNGKDFFSGSISEFMKKLPVGLLTQVEIVNDYGGNAAFSGIKSQPSQKLLNLVVKPGMDNGVFGNISAAVGTNKLVQGDFSANYWKGIKQISGDINLINATSAIGVNINNKASLNYNDQLGKYLKINSNYNFNNSRNSANNSTFSETINSLGTINNQISNTSFVQSISHAFGLNTAFEPNEKTIVKLDLGLFFNDSVDSTLSNSQQTGLINQGLLLNKYTTSKSPIGSLNFTIGRKLSKPGRAIMANLQYKNSSNNTINNNYGVIQYDDQLSSLKKDSIADNLLTNRIKSLYKNITLSYTEPLSIKSHLDIIYTFTSSDQKTEFITENLFASGRSKIDSLSNYYENYNSTHKIAIDYRYEYQKITLVAGLNAQSVTLYSGQMDNAKAIKHIASNFAPDFNLAYNPNRSIGVDLRYAGENEVPAVNQLQPVRDINDLQNVFVGNPWLKSAFNHQVELNFRHYGAKSNQLLTFGLAARLTQNKIVTNTILISENVSSLKQLTSFINANGSHKIGGKYNYSIPIKISGMTLKTSFSGNIDFTREVVYTDNVKAYNFSRNISQTIKTSASSAHFNSEVSVNYAASFNSYHIGQGLVSDVHTWMFSLNENIIVDQKTTLNIGATKTFNYGYVNIGSNNPFVVNASVSRSFFKQDLMIKIQASDLFNQANRISQFQKGNSIVNNRKDYISRFVSLGISYKLSKFGHLK